MEQSLVAAVIVFSVVSNIFLWMNLWNLKERLFEFQRRNIEYLKELCKKPAEDGPGKSPEQAADSSLKEGVWN